MCERILRERWTGRLQGGWEGMPWTPGTIARCDISRIQKRTTLVGWSRCRCGLLHGRLRCLEARGDDLRGTRGLRATTGRTWTATSIRCDVAHLLAANIHSLLAAVARLLNSTVVVLMATVVAVLAALVATVPGLGICGAEHQSERRSEHTQRQ